MKLLIILIFFHCSFADDNGIWVRWNGKIPRNAVLGGRDNGGVYYVARAPHSNNNGGYIGLIPGKYSPGWGNVWISYGGEEYGKGQNGDFEILTHTNFKWTSPDDHESRMIPGGNQGDEIIYICRELDLYVDRVMPGKYHDGICYYPSGNERKAERFEILREA